MIVVNENIDQYTSVCFMIYFRNTFKTYDKKRN